LSGFGQAARRLMQVVAAAVVASGVAAPVALSAGELVAEPSVVDFGPHAEGVSSDRAVTIRNLGPDAVQLSDLWIEGQVDPFDFIGGSCDLDLVLAVDHTCDVVVRFTGPQVPQTPPGTSFGVSLLATGGVDDVPASATLSGSAGGGSSLAVDLTRLDFGSAPGGTTGAPRAVRVTNAGGQNMGAVTASVTGAFVLASNGCSRALAPGASCDVQVAFRPGTGFLAREQAEESGRLTISVPFVPLGGHVGPRERVVDLSGEALKPSGKRYLTWAGLASSIKAGLARTASE
jgi:hypothetical protein